MVDNNPIIKTINTYTVVPTKLTLVSTPTKVLKKQQKIRVRTRLATIKRAQSDTTASAMFLSTALHSVFQDITRENSHIIAMYNKKYTDCCAEDNHYATLGDTTKLPIDGICTTIYKLNGRTILTCNALHIPALQIPLYSLRKHHQRPGYGVYS